MKNFIQDMGNVLAGASHGPIEDGCYRVLVTLAHGPISHRVFAELIVLGASFQLWFYRFDAPFCEEPIQKRKTFLAIHEPRLRFLENCIRGADFAIVDAIEIDVRVPSPIVGFDQSSVA